MNCQNQENIIRYNHNLFGHCVENGIRHKILNTLIRTPANSVVFLYS